MFLSSPRRQHNCRLSCITWSVFYLVERPAWALFSVLFAWCYNHCLERAFVCKRCAFLLAFPFGGGSREASGDIIQFCQWLLGLDRVRIFGGKQPGRTSFTASPPDSKSFETKDAALSSLDMKEIGNMFTVSVSYWKVAWWMSHNSYLIYSKRGMCFV